MEKKLVIFSIIPLLFISFTGLFLVNIITVSGATIYVDDNGGQDYTSIQDAINSANIGDTVYVYSGTYYESLSISKNINITGSGKGDSIIDGSGSSHVVEVSADNVTIQGFTIKNGTYGVRIENAFNCTIKENTIRETNYGSYIDNSSNNTIYSNNFINNTQDAYDEHSNTWDDGYPNGGNYWDDYSGRDANSDGIGDTAFDIPGGNNQDRYPIIEPITEPPHVDFIYSQFNPTTQDTIHFLDVSEDLDGYIISWFWDFGDGNTSDVTNPSHQYADNGVYTVLLNIVDDCGSENQTTRDINVLNTPPIANFSISPEAPNDLQNITFNDTSEDLDGIITNWSWDFGDGNTSNLSTPGHQYEDNGSYAVTLNVTDDDGDVTSLTREILVLNVIPTATFIYTPNNPTTNDTIQYTDLSKDSDGTIVSYSWDLGDGTISTEPNPSHKYTGMGTYQVSLTVTDDDGDSSTDTQEIKIFEPTTAIEDYTGYIIVVIVFIVMFSVLISVVIWFSKKEE